MEQNEMISWQLKDVDVAAHYSSNESRLTSKKYPDAVLLIRGKEAGDHVKAIQAESKKAWHTKSSGKEWIRNGLLMLALLGGLFLVYLLIVPWLSQKLASKISVQD